MLALALVDGLIEFDGEMDALTLDDGLLEAEGDMDAD